MNNADAIHRLRQHADALKSMGATALYLLVSSVRDRTQASTNVKLCIDYDPGQRFSLLHLIGIKHFLEGELETAVDLTTRNSLDPMMQTDIEQSAIRIF